MSDKPQQPVPEEESPRPGESFFSRVHRRKTEARSAAVADTEPATVDDSDLPIVVDLAEPSTDNEPTDADMPPLESLDRDSDYTGFLSPRVSESLRRAALRKLFHGSAFNVIDELDDYAEDFTSFEALGDIITADMRHQLEVEAKKKAEAARQALLADDEASVVNDDEPEPAQMADTSAKTAAEPEATPDTLPAEPSDPETELPHAQA